MRLIVTWVARYMLCAAMAFAAPAVHATTYTWLGLGFDYDWTDSGNWDGNAQNPYPGYSPFNHDDAVLPAASQAYLIVLSSGFLQVDNITVAAPYELDVNGELAIHQNVTGSGLTINAAGALYFYDSANAGSAAISVSNADGVLYFTSDASAGTAAIDSIGAVMFQGHATATSASLSLHGGSLDVSGMVVPLTLNSLHDTLASPGSLALGTASLTLASAANQNFHGSVSGTGVLAQAGSGTLTLSGNNAAFTGGLSAQAGALQVDGDFSVAAVTIDHGAALHGSGRAGAVNLVDGTLAPGGGTGVSLRMASLACSVAQITFDLDAGTHLVVDQALTVALCPQWHITLIATQPLASGQSFTVATLSAGTDYSLANIMVTPPAGYKARAGRRGNDVIVTLFDPSDEIFGNGFD